MTLKCTKCGMDFPVDMAKCKKCKSPMTCTEGTCKCQNCGHTQDMDNMWCPSCLNEKSTS